MKLTLVIDGLATLPRYDATRLTARLQSELERELQATAATSAAPLDATARHAALARTLQRVGGNSEWGMGSRDFSPAS